MKQITYEEVNKSIKRLINIVQIVDEDDLGELGFEYSNEEFQDDLADTRDFIEQHKPPTWDEVQRALKDAYPMSDVYQIGNTVMVDFEEQWVQGICVENNQVYISNCRTEMHTTEYEAINLTIRYLEAQGVMKNEKA